MTKYNNSMYTLNVPSIEDLETECPYNHQCDDCWWDCDEEGAEPL